MLFWCFTPSSADRARLKGYTGVGGTFRSSFGNLFPRHCAPLLSGGSSPGLSQPLGRNDPCSKPHGMNNKPKISPDVPVQHYIPSTGDQLPWRASRQDTGWFGGAVGSSSETHAPRCRASTHISTPRGAPGSSAPAPGVQSPVDAAPPPRGCGIFRPPCDQPRGPPQCSGAGSCRKTPSPLGCPFPLVISAEDLQNFYFFTPN